MRKSIILCSLWVVVIAGGLAAYGQAGGNEPASAKAQPILGVDEFMKRVDQHPGTVVVEGVVSSASAEKELLALIDVKEFKKCKTTTCPKLRLPVRWAGAMPEVEDAVQVEGQVEESDGKLVFLAKSLAKIELPQEPR